MTIIIYVLVILFLFSFYENSRKESLVSKPSNDERDRMSREVMSNRQLFTNKHVMQDARLYMPWMDAITYEDLRKLIRDKKFTLKNIETTLI